MNRSAVVIGVVAVLIGSLVGFVWWGLPTGRLETELREARTSTDRLSQQLEELRMRNQGLEAQLKAEKTRFEAVERDLRREKELSARLHLLVSEGKK